MTPESVKRATGEAVQTLRLTAKLSPGQMGVSRQTLYNIEQGKSLANIWTLACIARALHISLPALVLEIERRRDLPPIESGEERMLNGTLLIIRTGHLDASKTPQFHAGFLESVKRHQAKKVLLDFAGVDCSDFSQKEEYYSIRALVKLLKEAGCYPIALAAVGNATMDGFALEVLDHHGCPSRLFSNREEALAWLKTLTLGD